jgi:cobalt-zinc-cadmium efflux system outer membrane protein
MRVRTLAALAVAAAVATPAASEEHGPSYDLEQLRAIARSAHPTLESAEAAAEASAGLVRQSAAYPNPEVYVAFGRGRARGGGGSASENQIELVQPIEMPGIRRWRKRLAETRLRGAEVDLLLSETVVDSTVARLVYSVLLEERRAAIARESAAIAGRLRDLLAERAKAGESSPLEVAKAGTEWFARRRDLLDAEAAAGAARSALRLFCSNRIPDGFGIEESLRSPTPADLPPDLTERLLAENPILLRAAIAVEEAGASAEVARKQVFPRIGLVGGHETELDREAWSVGIGLSIPLWNRNRGTILAATSRQTAASAEVRALTLQMETALEQAKAAYRRALGAIRLHEEGWTESARRSLEIVTFSFENGEASLLDVLDAQRSYLSVGLAEAESWAALALARAEIERMIAGPLAAEDSDERL